MSLDLDHRIDAFGYRLVEADARRMLPDRLAAAGIAGPDVGRLQRARVLEVGGRVVRLEEVSEPRSGRRFAFVMDTRLCPAIGELADGVDLLVIESTSLDADLGLAVGHGHLTAGQAARLAAECGVRALVLTHFSRRHDDPGAFRSEAARFFDGEIVIAEDLLRIPFPETPLRQLVPPRSEVRCPA